MKKISIFFLILLTISCQNESIDFDSVYHYNHEISEEDVTNLLTNENLNPQQSELLNIISEKFLNCNDSILINRIENYYPKVKKIDTEKLSKIKEIYRNSSNQEDSKCLPIYRDILIFKKNDSIVAVSKICFDCDLVYTLKSDKKLIEIDIQKLNDLKELLR